MPGPVSDSYDPEFGTSENSLEIDIALEKDYNKLSDILGQRDPLFILDLVEADLPAKITATLTEKEWRLLRFAVERARDSI